MKLLDIECGERRSAIGDGVPEGNAPGEETGSTLNLSADGLIVELGLRDQREHRDYGPYGR